MLLFVLFKTKQSDIKNLKVNIYIYIYIYSGSFIGIKFCRQTLIKIRSNPIPKNKHIFAKNVIPKIK